jgi:ATP-dependent metalloprotease FtsH
MVIFSVILLQAFFGNSQEVKELSYTQFINHVKEDRVGEVIIKGALIRGILVDGSKFKTLAPQESVDELVQLLIEKDVQMIVEEAGDRSWVLSLLLSFLLPVGLIVLLWIYMMRRVQGEGSSALSFGRSQAKLVSKERSKVTFADVAGIDEVKEEVQEVVDYLKDPQRFVQIGAQIPKGVLLVGAPGTGKCIAGDSLILTNKGLMEIQDVPKYFYVGSDNKVYGAKVSTIDLDNLKLTQPATSHWYNLGLEDTLIVTTKLGHSIEGTYEHKIVVLGEEGELVFKSLDQLKVGDYVAIKYNSQVFGNLEEVSKETAYLLGLLVGDGGTTIKNRISFTTKEPELLDFVSEYLKKHYNYKLKKGTGPFDYYISDSQIKKDLLRWGLLETYSKGKKVPEWVLLSKKPIVVSFLQGLFDTDSYVDPRGYISYSSASETLVKQVSTLLLNLGVVNRIHSRLKRYNGKLHFYLEISGDYLETFEREVGFRLKRKRDELHLIAKKTRNTNNNLIPKQHKQIDRIWRFLVESDKKPYPTVERNLYKNIRRYARGERKPSVGALQTVVAEISQLDPQVEDLAEYHHLERMAWGDLFFSPVTSIKRSRNVVYDFTVPGQHSFIANGMINHNTLLARAIAGEADVPFFSISGSDFVEMFVGVGAARVRDLFRKAKEETKGKRGAIIFIDEIDAVGRKRGTGIGGGHDEREQTLNQLLAEMDGFEKNEHVIILAATNRPDILDTALLRPGRFDRKISIPPPDLAGREKILKVHTKDKKLAPEVDLGILARRTPGFVGADLENLANEAALLAARRNKSAIEMRDFEDAIDRVIAGIERKGRLISEEEKEKIAYHEAGHALLSKLLPKADPVHRISIVPRGEALGYTLQYPLEDRYLFTKRELLDRVTSSLGGRAAEEVVFGEVSTGAYDDLKKSTEIVKRMVVSYGMSDKIGPMNLGRDNTNVFLGEDLILNREHSDKMSAMVDEEIRSILEQCYQQAKELLKRNRKALDKLAQTLLETEVLEGEQVDEVLKGIKLN